MAQPMNAHQSARRPWRDIPKTQRYVSPVTGTRYVLGLADDGATIITPHVGKA